jgi:hypothetical protein
MANGKFLEKNHAIYLTLTSDGTTGEQWINRLESQGKILSIEVQHLLKSLKFEIAKGQKSDLVILKKTLTKALALTKDELLAEAFSLHLLPVNLELACLLREELTLPWLDRLNLQRVIIPGKPSLVIFGDGHFRTVDDVPDYLRESCFGYVFRQPQSHEYSQNGWSWKTELREETRV